MSNKKSKLEVHYRRGTPDQNCGNCTYMQNDGRCQKVIGFVDRMHICDEWDKGPNRV